MNLEDFKSFCRVLIPSEVGSIPTHSRQPRRRCAARFAAAALFLLAAAADPAAGQAVDGPPPSSGVVPPPVAPAGPDSAAPAAGTALPDSTPGSGLFTPPDSAPASGISALPDSGAGPATVAFADSTPPPPELAPLVPGALQRAFRSALFPAWGQLTNGHPKKAVVLFSFQTYIYTRIILETRRAREARRRVDRLTAENSDDPVVLADLAAAEASSQDHYGRRRDLMFWALIGGFYGAMDAYIDAHLGDFEGELDKDRSLFGGVDPARGTVELGMRF